ncbi:hypothetical protein GCM10009676_17500 [Prauserella halophila]|uniref:Uncharacterized protein n=1 Tax=Prauserella halophila TaxID=185641 RepID=A0ABN1W5W3_9PSEU|nr:hypothetical protein [Prauserella halophila]MCP2236049.1 hypothetical protein [Prauserella halophila]
MSHGTTGRARAVAAGWLVLLSVDAVLLALLELFFLPLRLDGTLLPRFGDVPFPIVVVLAVVTTPWLVSAASRLGERRLGMVPLVVWVLTVLVVGVAGPGDDHVLLADLRTLLLLGGGAVPAALVLGGVLGRAARESLGASSSEQSKRTRPGSTPTRR